MRQHSLFYRSIFALFFGFLFVASTFSSREQRWTQEVSATTALSEDSLQPHIFFILPDGRILRGTLPEKYRAQIEQWMKQAPQRYKQGLEAARKAQQMLEQFSDVLKKMHQDFKVPPEPSDMQKLWKEALRQHERAMQWYRMMKPKLDSANWRLNELIDPDAATQAIEQAQDALDRAMQWWEQFPGTPPELPEGIDEAEIVRQYQELASRLYDYLEDLNVLQRAQEQYKEAQEALRTFQEQFKDAEQWLRLYEEAQQEYGKAMEHLQKFRHPDALPPASPPAVPPAPSPAAPPAVPPAPPQQ